jgi:DnaJ-class molecular chaperone
MKKLFYFSVRNFTKLDLNKDYYKILGLTPDATDKDIKNAYLKSVKKYHPDLNEGKTTELFKEISYSYEILSDEGKKRYYDSNSFRSNENNFTYSSFDEKKKKTKETSEEYDFEDFDFENRHKFYEKKQKNKYDKNENKNYGPDSYHKDDSHNYIIDYFLNVKEFIDKNLNYQYKIILFIIIFSLYELFIKKEEKDPWNSSQMYPLFYKV